MFGLDKVIRTGRLWEHQIDLVSLGSGLTGAKVGKKDLLLSTLATIARFKIIFRR
jgi:hypothetical protein